MSELTHAELDREQAIERETVIRSAICPCGWGDFAEYFDGEFIESCPNCEGELIRAD